MLQLPSNGYAYVQVVHNPGGGSVTNLSTKTIVKCSGESIIVRLADVHITNCEGMCLLVMYHSFVDTCSERHADSRESVKQVVRGNSDAQCCWGMPVVCGGDNPVVQLESKDAVVNVQISKFVNMYNLVQACCESNNLTKRPSRHNGDFNIIEITEREDFRSPAGRLIATKSLRGPMTHYSSLPPARVAVNGR